MTTPARVLLLMALVALMCASMCGAATTRGFTAKATAVTLDFIPSHYAPVSGTAYASVTITYVGTPVLEPDSLGDVTITGVPGNGAPANATVPSVSVTAAEYDEDGDFCLEDIPVTMPSEPGEYIYTASIVAREADNANTFRTISSSPEICTAFRMTVTRSKDAIVAGAIDNSVHQCTITAEIEPGSVTGYVSFEITAGRAGENTDAALSSTCVALALNTGTGKAEASTTLTSSDLVSSQDWDTGNPVKAVVEARFEDYPGETEVEFIEPGGTFTASKTVFAGDGEEATLTRILTFGDPAEAIPGHRILFEIISIWDVDGNLVYDLDTGLDNTGGQDYGSIAPATAVTTDADGKAEATFTWSDLASSLIIRATDLDVFKD